MRKAVREEAARERSARATPGAALGTDERALAARLRRINLDLLPVLHELRTGSVTRTARTFGMTQPAASRALRQLRAAFEDELLVSLGRDAQLTERAEALVSPLQRALGDIDLLLRPANPFNPAVEPAHIVIATADYVSLLLAPILAEICTAEAPQAVFEFINALMRNAEDLARVDFLIAPRASGETLGKRIGAMPLWRDEIVCIAAAANTAIPECITPRPINAPATPVFGPIRGSRPMSARCCSRPRVSRPALLHRAGFPGSGCHGREDGLPDACPAQAGARTGPLPRAEDRRGGLLSERDLHRRLLKPCRQRQTRPCLVPSSARPRGGAPYRINCFWPPLIPAAP